MEIIPSVWERDDIERRNSYRKFSMNKCDWVKSILISVQIMRSFGGEREVFESQHILT